MRTYDSKYELIEAIERSYDRYDQEFNEIPESLKDVRIEGIDRTPLENLAYQLGWTGLLLE